MCLRLLPSIILYFIFTTSAAAKPWTVYKNDSFGYRVAIPSGMLVVDRAQDDSGLTWQTGSVRIQVYGINNPYSITASSWFSKVRKAAGDRIVDERRSKEGESPRWQEILYLKKGRRHHRKTFVEGNVIISLEVSYAYSLREEKQPIGQRIIDSLLLDKPEAIR